MSEPKKPQDHKSKSDTYEWTTPAGVSLKLQPFGRIKAGVFRQVRNMSDLDATFTLLEAAADEKNLAIVDALEYEDIDKLFLDWSTDSRVEVPQS